MPRVTPAPDLARRLGSLQVRDVDGEPVALGELWSREPVVLAHLRHFG